MRKAMQGVAVVTLLFSSLAMAQSAQPKSAVGSKEVRAEDRREIEQLVKQNDQAVQKGDIEKFSAHFTEDATLINPAGDTLKGRAEIREQYSKYFEGVLKDPTEVKTTIESLRPIAPGVVLLDGERVLSGGPNLPSGPGNPFRVHYTGLLVKSDDGGYRIAEARIYSHLDPEAPAVGGAGQAGQDGSDTCPCPMMEEGMGPMGPPTMREGQRE